MILEEDCRVKNSIIRRPKGTNGHVGTIRKGEGCPCIVRGGMIYTVRLNVGKSIKTIIVARCAVGDVQRGIGVVEAIRIDDTVVDRGSSLIKMSMPIYIQIHVVRIEQFLESSLTVSTH